MIKIEGVGDRNGCPEMELDLDDVEICGFDGSVRHTYSARCIHEDVCMMWKERMKDVHGDQLQRREEDVC